ncbi:MAG: DNA mismatch repair endonuclease MutL [Paludibacteraceae bacterium]|nr:DNA mismatch repair endonuclease MutL [Paludibacteraceae bacterium]MBR6146119.1 DNA mismatch repair endonuclease MutL [Paludibacteraceae bacterium]
MDIIHLLPDSVANQIAAGEVIQRPASCIKELVENSLDAGATTIQVLVREAGRTLVQVIDDGKGMSETDVRMAFERHATSKISNAADLFALTTMGFRGEALAAICAVAQVDVTTRRAEDEVGSFLEINGSEVIRQEICQAPVGTNIRVKNLFFNTPARRKYLKPNRTELRNILIEFYRIVLVNPQVAFTLVSDDEVLLDLPVGTHKQRIEQVFGKSQRNQFTAGLVEMRTDTDIVSIRGFVGKPEYASKSPQQYFFVNNRFMRHPYFQKAVLTAYQGMLPPEHNPSYFIYFDIAPESIDVNIHPTKTEIKFADEQTIWQILQAAVRESLGKFHVAPSIDFDTPLTELDLPQTTIDPSRLKQPSMVFNPNYNPFEQQATSSSSFVNLPSAPRKQQVTGWEKLYDEPELKEELTLPEDVHPLQIAGRYIAVAVPDGLMLVDQHRAHMTVLFAEIEQQMQSGHAVQQQLLFPETLELSADDMLLMRQLQDQLLDLGFELEQLSSRAYAVNSVPALLGNEAPQRCLNDILAAVRETGISAKKEWNRQIALTMARDTAVAYGKTLLEQDMSDLLKRLLALPVYTKTPDGKTVMTILTETELEKRFTL